MAINISQDLKTRIELLSKSIIDIEKKLELLPEGRIAIKHQFNKYYYYHAGIPQRERYLSAADTALISDLVQKDYLKRVLKQIKCELSAIEKMQKLYPETIAEDVFDSLSDARKQYARPINVCDDAYAEKWMAVPYKRKPFKKDAPEFYTIKGERVRSKSEVIIADRLRAQGIPYRYECPLKVGNRIIHPDFTILRMSDRKILYHEHCGKMNDSQYTDDLIIRAKDYNRTGIILGDKLFFTFESETTPLDMTMLDNIISQHYR
jgi:hypothetical protein